MSEPTLTRRSVLAGAALAAPALLSHRAAAAEQCIVGTWGGDYARLLKENIDDPILKPEGIDIIQDVGQEDTRVAKLIAQRRLPRNSIDIACVGAPEGYHCTEAGLLETLDETKVPNLKHVLPKLRSDTFIPHIYSAQVLVYNPDTVKEPPNSFGDLLDPKWKGKVGMIGTNSFWGMMGASLYASGNVNDFDKAKEFFLKLNDNGLRLYPTTDSLAPPFKSGEIEVGIVWLARTVMWRKGGFPVMGRFPKEGAVLYVSGMVMPKNAPDKEAAYKYMNALLDPRAQQGFAANMSYLPTVDDAPLSGQVGQDLALPDPAPNLVVPDYAYDAKVKPEIDEWWMKNIAKS